MRLSLTIAAAAAMTSGAASAAQVWTAPAAVKVRPQAQVPAGASTAASLAAAQNEFQAFQVVVTGQASGVSMALEGLSDGKGHVISGRDVTLYREALINVTQPTGGEGAAGMWPDALVPDVDPIVGEKRNAFPFDVPANESRVVYVDVHVPATAPAGTYTGTLNVTGGVSAQISIALTVWDFAVPSTSTLRSAFGMTWNGPCMGHGDGGCTNVVAEQQLRARYIQAALDNHISIDIPYYTAPVSSGGSETWGDFDKYAGPFLDGTASTRLAGAKLTAVRISGARNSAVARAWGQHFKAKGWFSSLFNYVCDEPPMTCLWTDIPLRAAASRAGDPEIPTLVTTTNALAAANGVTSSIDLFVPVINWVEGRPGSSYSPSQRPNYGPKIWWYQSCMSFGCSGVGPGYNYTNGSGWPTYAIDSDATRNRAMEWMSFSYDVSGELYYEVTMAYFTADPWVNQYNYGGTGDGTLFYPGTSGRIGGSTEIPVESLRMKGIRDGMEDYELLAMAARLGMADQAKQIARRVYPVTYQARTTPEALEAARGELATMILKALGKSTGGSGGGGGGGGGIPPAGAPPPNGQMTGFPHAGCSSSGVPQSAWLTLPLLALLALRRRRFPLTPRGAEDAGAVSGPDRRSQ